MRLAWWLTAAALLVLAPPVRAQDDEPSKLSFRVVVDGVDHEPASITGTRMTVLLSALTLQGQRLDLTDPKSIKTYLGTSVLKAPYSLGTFGATDNALAIVIVVQATLDYQEVLPVITEALGSTLLGALDDKTTQLAVLPYGEAVGTGKLMTLKAGRAKVTQLAHDGTAGEPALLETVERALLILKKAKTEPEGRGLRKMILVIGDGRDRAGDRERVTRLGERAGKDGVRIHSFAFSPTDQRRPLLLLGELSKRSLGTFRWLQRGQGADSWGPKFAHLTDEIDKQYVLTYYLGPDEDPAGKKLTVVTIGRTEGTSNEVKVPSALCNREACAGYCVSDRCVVPQAPEDRGVLGWVLLIGGIVVGALVVLGVIGYVITNRSQRIPLPPGVLPPSKPPAGKSLPPPPVVMAPAVAPHLMFVTGPRAGQRMPLRHGFMIGKAPNCDLVIEDGYTSTNHAQIGMDGAGNCKLFDQGSTNGTFINGVRVTEATLEHGISIRIGSTELRFLAQ
ncbi:MAG: FHA domain-containing protein [Deltaproteobacteria bacterium]|nr:FHA domain-containing protein [Deltaproteobacteria bacterium]